MANRISNEMIEYVGILAKLELSEEEKAQAGKDMEQMLDYIDKLNELLCMLTEHPGRILSKGQILEHLFDSDGNFVNDNAVAVNINRLRDKIEPDRAAPAYIKNVRGLGYVWSQECRWGS